MISSFKFQGYRSEKVEKFQPTDFSDFSTELLVLLSGLTLVVLLQLGRACWKVLVKPELLLLKPLFINDSVNMITFLLSLICQKCAAGLVSKLVCNYIMSKTFHQSYRHYHCLLIVHPTLLCPIFAASISTFGDLHKGIVRKELMRMGEEIIFHIW